LYYFGAPHSPKCPSILDLLVHHVKNQISISTRYHILLKKPICKIGTLNGQSHAGIKHTDVVLDDQPISRGSYSDTYVAVLKISGRCVTVQKCHLDYNKTQCLNAAEVLKKCNHENIAEFVGVSTDVTPMYIITELMLGGILKHYLQEKKSSIGSTQLMSFCRQVASGMDYFTSQNYVHRDLKASSCMVDEFGSNITLKISDFRMTKKMSAHRYVSNKTECQAVAVRWTAPEVMRNRVLKPDSLFSLIVRTGQYAWGF